MNKAELIKQLYEEGKITFDQAMILTSNEEAQIPSPVESSSRPIQNKKEIFIKTLIEDMINHNEEDGVLFSFDINKVVEYMNSSGWTWEEDKVTVDRFKGTLKSYLKDVITDTVNDYLNGVWKDTYSESDTQWPCCHTIQGGGIEVESWYNNESDVIEVNAKFVIEEAMTCASVDLLK